MSALKWVLYLTKPSDMIFMADWNIAMSKLQGFQQMIQKATNDDMLITDRGQIVELRGMAKILKHRVAGPIDSASLLYKVPDVFKQEYINALQSYSLNPIAIRNQHGILVPMGPEAETVVAGSLCIVTFTLRHYFIERVQRDCFNADLVSIKVLVPSRNLAKVKRDMGCIDSDTLAVPNAFRSFMKRTKSM
ncbi:hypothetical protein EDD18DRAFT_1107755 [Armillaria luteobubalina]|uniref:Uncharacterized protein n=1 Tax=Armillaria luteobubalina TaxID=153913 RepID=A0AA39TLA2_9AGAR|nr:hypothetical protein EDD18DRAFT_1107755 [Armillaria luteobubalina]